MPAPSGRLGMGRETSRGWQRVPFRHAVWVQIQWGGFGSSGALTVIPPCAPSVPCRRTQARLAGRGTPLLLRGALGAVDWPALRWSESATASSGPASSAARGLAALRAEHGHRLVSVRLAPRAAPGTPWEGQCCLIPSVGLGKFCAWLAGEATPAGEELSAYPLEDWWSYCAYQHFETLFPDVDGANQAAADFSRLLGQPLRASGAPTLWLGSAGARTPCHQDAYGSNVVAQLAGRKRWLLFPPRDADRLGPVRLPYEDASTFTTHDPLASGAPVGCSGFVAELGPLDVLFVPRHWFHAVECVSPWSLSLNQWLDAEEDVAERVREATVRCLIAPLVEGRPQVLGS